MKINIFKRIKELEDNVHKLQVESSKLCNELEIAKDQIENLTENIKSLERINLYGRGDEPEVIVDNVRNGIDWWNFEPGLRLYIDGEEYTIRNVDNLRPDYYRKIFKKSIMVNGDIATVVIQQDPDVEDIYHIEYDKGAYVHQIRRIEKEKENV